MLAQALSASASDQRLHPVEAEAQADRPLVIGRAAARRSRSQAARVAKDAVEKSSSRKHGVAPRMTSSAITRRRMRAGVVQILSSIVRDLQIRFKFAS